MMESVTLQMNQRGVITLPKRLREAYNLRAGETFTLLDLGGVFVLAPRASEVDRIADQIAAQWSADGQTLETMLQALSEERERRAH
jgi:bifunctional DNA-binding transcriptional regulator/antitoxin component of YhaV-PrlF toxin-antitoxin module